MISKDIQQRIQAIIGEQNVVIKERQDVIHGAWVARIAQEHLLMLGPGGTGKSFLVRDMVSHIVGAAHFETSLDERTDPVAVFGPPNIKKMVEDGTTTTVTRGMLPDATDAFVDEIFNGNAPVLHALMPILNERVFHDGGLVRPTPLRTVYAGSNKVNADADLAPFFDRLHLRYHVGYVAARDSQADMVAQAVARMSVAGRGTTTSIATSPTTVTLEELDTAHTQALALDVDDAVMATFLDLKEELVGNGIVISDRRMVEGMVAVMANAWLRGHSQVRPGDLDILANMWWTLLDQVSTTRSVILAATNPGEKAALELLDDLDKLRAEVKAAHDSDMDDNRKRMVGVEVWRNSDKLLRDAKEYLVKAQAAGHSTTRLDETVARTNAFRIEVGTSLFKLDPKAVTAMAAAG